VFAAIVLPAFFATRQPEVRKSPSAKTVRDAIRPTPAQPGREDSSSAASAPVQPVAAPTRTRATAAWELSDGKNPQEAATKIHELLRAETDDRVRCEIIGAASTVDANPALHSLFEESADASQSSRVRQVALDLWLTVYPDEAPIIAKRFLTDRDEDVRGIAEEYFQAKREEAKQR
jgi:hypothetical protein